MSGDTGNARVEAAPRVVDDLETCDFYHAMAVPGTARWKANGTSAKGCARTWVG
ncbi:hypothetical protein BH18ACT4_BH18ACT4_09950 [soil metagenome]